MRLDDSTLECHLTKIESVTERSSRESPVATSKRTGPRSSRESPPLRSAYTTAHTITLAPLEPKAKSPHPVLISFSVSRSGGSVTQGRTLAPFTNANTATDYPLTRCSFTTMHKDLQPLSPCVEIVTQRSSTSFTMCRLGAQVLQQALGPCCIYTCHDVTGHALEPCVGALS